VTFNDNSAGLFTVSAASINNSGDLTNSGTGTGTITISGNIGGNVTNVIQNSATSMLAISGSNTFRGGLYILNGTVSASTSTNALGVGTVYLGDISGSASATLLGDARIFPNPIVVQSGSSGTLAIANIGNSAVVFNGNITQNSPLSLFAGGTGSVQLSGVITGTNQITTDTTNAAAYVNLSGNSPNFAGPVLVDSGVLRIGSATALSASNTVVLNTGSVLDVQNFVTIACLQDGTGAGYVTNSSANARTLTLGGTGTNSFSGTIADNSPAKPTSLVKIGSGIQTLAGADTYTGNTTIGGGTLAIEQATLATNSTITVSNGAVLQLDFTVTNTVAGLVLNGANVTGVHNNSTDPAIIHGMGSLLALSSIAANPTNITSSVSGNTLNLTWPADHLGWLVQSNSVNLTVPADWYDISNTVTVTNFSVTMDLTKTNVFYRLRKP
jgi:fibronectin-binding autotransporter adhesin